MMTDAFGPIKKTRIAENLASEIKQRILKGNLIPGNRLPSERELAGQCSTSRTTVREAFRLLENEGLLTIKQGIDGGAFITEVNHEIVEHSLGVFFNYGDVSIANLMETRMIVEPEIAKLAAGNRTDVNLKELESVLDYCQSQIDLKKTDMANHLQFHTCLARASQNPLLMAISNSVIRFIGRKVGSTDQFTNYEYHVKDQQFHREIYLAVKKKNPQLARSTMVKHIEVFSERLLRDPK